MGGSPLTNDVWAADITQNSAGVWVFTWEEMASGDGVPFSPRAGLGGSATRTLEWPAAIAIIPLSQTDEIMPEL